MENIGNKIDRLTNAVLLLAKMVAKSHKVHLTKNEKFAFSQIAPTQLPAFGELLEGKNNTDK